LAMMTLKMVGIKFIILLLVSVLGRARSSWGNFESL
jgi:hypothetical protein